MTNDDDDSPRTLCCLCFVSHSLPQRSPSHFYPAPLLHVFFSVRSFVFLLLYIKWLFQVQCQICGANYCNTAPEGNDFGRCAISMLNSPLIGNHRFQQIHDVIWHIFRLICGATSERERWKRPERGGEEKKLENLKRNFFFADKLFFSCR